jgi:autotransporter-associated beta strand protein
MNGVHTGGGDYSVYGSASGNNAYLHGKGVISASSVNIWTNGYLSPGFAVASTGSGSASSAFSDTTAILTLSNTVVNFGTNSTLEIQVSNTVAGTGYDQVNIAGTSTLTNLGANLSLKIGYTPATGDKFTIVQVQGTSSANNTGTFATLNGVATDLSQGATFVDPITLKTFQISYRAEGTTFDAGAGNGNDIMLQVVQSAAANLTWRGNGADNNWDVNTTSDWVTNGVLTTFTNGNIATFDDSGSNNIPVNLTTTVSPAGLTINATKSYVLSGAGNLSGNFVTVKTNSGTLAIINENTSLLGDTFVKGGKLQIGTNGTTGSWVGSGAVRIDTNGVFAYNRADDVIPSLNLVSTATGAGTFLKTGDGKLTLTNALTSFTGLTVNTNGGPITIGNGSDNGSIGGTVVLGSTNRLTYFFTKNMNILNALSGSGTADYESDGNNSWTFTIPATVMGSTNFTGTNNVGNGIKLVTVNDGPGYQLGNGSVVKLTDGYNQLSLGRGNYNLNLILGSSGWTTDPSALTGFRATLSGSMTLAANTTVNLSGATVYDTISGGSFNLTINGGGLGSAGNEVLFNPTNGANAYGTTTIGTNGYIKCGNSGALSTNGLTLLSDPAGSAWLDINGNTVTVASLSGAGGFIGNGSATSNATLVVGTDDTSTEFDGLFGNNGSQPLNLTKVGAGTLTLTGASTNTGTVAVSGGSIALSGSGSFDNATALAVGSGATLDVSGRGNGTLTLTASQILKHSGATVGQISVNGNLTMGSGVLQMALNRVNSPATNDSLVVTGGTLTPGGTLQVVNAGPALHAGDTFQLFAGGVGAGFSVSLPASDGNGYQYTWSDQVAASGYIQVLTAAPALGGNLFRTVASGNWSNASIWQRSTNGVDWVAAAIAPTDQASNILVQAHSVTNDADVIVDQLTIQSGGAVYVAGGNFIVTNGIGSDCVVTGKVEVVTGSGNIIVDPAATLSFANGGLFNWNRHEGPVIPAATWQDGSTCRVTATYLGANRTMAGFSGQSYYDFVYDTTAGGQTNDRCYFGLTNTTTVIRRDLTINMPDAGGARVYLANDENTLLTVGRNVAWNGGSETNQGNKIVMQGASYTNFVIKVGGNVSVAGVLDGFAAPSSSTFEFNGSSIQTLTMPTTNLLHGNLISYQVDAGKSLVLGADLVSMNTLTNLGTLTFGTHRITGGTNLVLSAGGTVNGNGTNQLVSGVTSVVNGGTLNLTNSVSLPTFAGGESFTLFGASSYSGTFGTLLPTAPDGTHTWVTTQLNSAGILAVSGGTPLPASITFSQISSTKLVLNWPAGQGWTLQSQTNSLSNGLGTNWVNVSGATPPFTNTINSANGSVFFRLKY